MSLSNKTKFVALMATGFFFLPCFRSVARAANSLPIDHNEPIDRRIIDTTRRATLSPQELNAKRAEAAAMIRWFEAKQRIYKSELAQHLIEIRFNKQTLDRLQSLSGSFPEVRLLEAMKLVEMDVFDTEQLQAYVDMSAADIAAAKARLQFLSDE